MNIELQQWAFNDKESLISICNSIDRSYLSDRLPKPYTEQSANWWLSMVADNESRSGVFRKIVVDGKVVGTVSVEQKQDVFRKDAEIGYFLLPEQNSKGIMSVAVKEICKIAFKELDIIRITGLVYEPNIASKKALLKNGFNLEGTMHNAVFKNGKIYNLCIYGKCK